MSHLLNWHENLRERRFHGIWGVSIYAGVWESGEGQENCGIDLGRVVEELHCYCFIALLFSISYTRFWRYHLDIIQFLWYSILFPQISVLRSRTPMGWRRMETLYYQIEIIGVWQKTRQGTEHIWLIFTWHDILDEPEPWTEWDGMFNEFGWTSGPNHFILSVKINTSLF